MSIFKTFFAFTCLSATLFSSVSAESQPATLSFNLQNSAGVNVTGCSGTENVYAIVDPTYIRLTCKVNLPIGDEWNPSFYINRKARPKFYTTAIDLIQIGTATDKHFISIFYETQPLAVADCQGCYSIKRIGVGKKP